MSENQQHTLPAESSAPSQTLPTHPTDAQRPLLTDEQLAHLPAQHPLRAGTAASSPMLQALTGRPSSHRPVWFMRQAGRSLPEYRRVREGIPMLEACLTPELAAEITVQPVRRHKVDAGIFFSDIVIPMKLAGVNVDIVPGKGPVLDRPVRTLEDVRALPELTESALDPIREAIAATVEMLGDTPLIGFAGAPFTVAAYMVEGGPSRDHLRPRTMMHADPAAWDRLMTWCARLTGEFIATQVRAGAAAAQLFDSWAGSLSPRAYRERVAPYSALALDVARQAVSPTTGEAAPLIHFGTGTARLLGLMRQAGADAVGVDERIELGEAIEALAEADPQAGACPVQGNLDPALLAAPWPILAEELDAVLAAGRAAPGHVVNLGHGVPPATDADVLTRIVARVHGSADWESVALAGWEA